jgi:hypothetical protein
MSTLIKLYTFNGGYLDKNFFTETDQFNINSNLYSFITPESIAKGSEYKLNKYDKEINYTDFYDMIKAYLITSTTKFNDVKLYYKKGDFYYVLIDSPSDKSLFLDININIKNIDQIEPGKIINKEVKKINILNVNFPYLKLLFLIKYESNKYINQLSMLYNNIDNPIRGEHSYISVLKDLFKTKIIELPLLIEHLFNFKPGPPIIIDGINTIPEMIIGEATKSIKHILNIFLTSGNTKAIFDIFCNNTNKNIQYHNIKYYTDIKSYIDEIKGHITSLKENEIKIESDEITVSILNKLLLIKDNPYKDDIKKRIIDLHNKFKSNSSMRDELISTLNYTYILFKINTILKPEAIIPNINRDRIHIYFQLIMDIIELQIITDNCNYEIKQIIICLFISLKIKYYENENNRFLPNPNLLIHDFDNKQPITPELIAIYNVLNDIHGNLKFRIWSDKTSCIKNTSIIYTNCGENTLLHLINFVLYNPEIDILEYKRLPSTILPEIYDYYMNNKTLDLVQKNTDDFDLILTKLEFTYYPSIPNSTISSRNLTQKDNIVTGYDISPDYFNIIRILNKLFGLNVYSDDKLFKNNEKVKLDGSELNIILKNIKGYDTNFVYNFISEKKIILEYKPNIKHTLELHLDFMHAYPVYRHKSNNTDIVYTILRTSELEKNLIDFTLFCTYTDLNYYIFYMKYASDAYLKAFLSDGYNLVIMNKTILFLAIEYKKSFDIINFILEKITSIKYLERDNPRENIVEFAIKNKISADILKLLLNKIPKENIDWRVIFYTAISNYESIENINLIMIKLDNNLNFLNYYDNKKILDIALDNYPIDFLRLLIDNISISTFNIYSEKLLENAFKYEKSAEIIKLLIEKNNFNYNITTGLLCLAITNEYPIEIYELIFKNKIKIYSYEDISYVFGTVIYNAIHFNKSIELIKFLINKMSEYIKLEDFTYNRNNILQKAIELHQPIEIIKLILKFPDKINNVLTYDKKSILEITIENNTPIEIIKLIVDKYPVKDTILFIALQNNLPIEIFSLLLEKIPIVNIYDNSGRSILDVAIYKNNIELIKLLIDKINIFEKKNLIHRSLESKKPIEIITLLLDKLPEFINDSYNNKNIIEIAIISKYPIDFINLLLEKMSQEKNKPEFWYNLLMLSIQYTNIDFLKLLFEKIPIDIKSIIDLSVSINIINLAISNNNSENFIQLILEKLPNSVNIQDKLGKTPLQFAINSNQPIKIIELIVNRTSPYFITIKNKNGISSIDLAKKNPDVLAIIEKKLDLQFNKLKLNSNTNLNWRKK